jgi:hypothetical protein
MTSQVRVIALAIVMRPQSREFLAFQSYDRTTGLIYHRPLGGGIEFGEPAEAAVRRELMEEIGVEVAPQRLLTATESIFTLHGKAGHQIALLVECRFADASLYDHNIFPTSTTMARTGCGGRWRRP